MSYAFDRLTLHRFRGIQDLELSGLGRFNLLVGKNNSGKTSVLEALALYCNPLDLSTWVAAARWRESPSLSRLHPARQLRWLFPQRSDLVRESLYSGDLRLSASGSFEIREVLAHLEEIRALVVMPEDGMRAYAATGDVYPGSNLSVHVQLESLERGGEGRVLEHSFTLMESGRSRVPTIEGAPRLQSRVVTPYAHGTTSLESLFSEAAKQGHRDAAVELIKSLGIRVEHVEVFSDEGLPVLYLQDSAAGFLPVSAFGDGVRRALLLALSIPLASKGVLLIDELETAIHVSMLGKVFDWVLEACHEHDVQIVATTHSLEAIDAILDADLTPREDVVAFRLERAEDRVTVKRFGEETLKHLRQDMGLDVR